MLSVRHRAIVLLPAEADADRTLWAAVHGQEPWDLVRVTDWMPERRAELHAETLQRIAHSSENDWRRFLLAECVEAYSELDEVQRQRLQAWLTTEQYQEVKPLMMTTYERGILQGQRQTALLLLEAKFGPLSPENKKRVEALSPEQLRQAILERDKAQSLKELGLQDRGSFPHLPPPTAATASGQ